MRRGKVVVVGIVAIGIVAMTVRSCRYERYRSACEGVAPGTPLVDAAKALEAAGGKHVAVVEREHQWLRVRLSLKHQLCRVKVDERDRVLSTRHEDSWDLL
jgi:hypothetical protein